MANRYTFSYSEGENHPCSYTYRDKEAEMSFEVEDSAQWEVPLREFCNFLSSIYGYDIASKVLREEDDDTFSIA